MTQIRQVHQAKGRAMNGFAWLVKPAALASSLLLVAAFIAMRVGFFEHRRDLFAALPIADTDDRERTRFFDLEFELVSGAAPRTEEHSDAGSADQDWLRSAFGGKQSPCLIQISEETLQVCADENRGRRQTLLSGSKMIVLDWSSDWRPSGPLVAGSPYSFVTKAGSNSLVIDEKPKLMFSDGSNPLVAVVKSSVLHSTSKPPLLPVPTVVDSSPTRPPRIPLGGPDPNITVMSGSKSFLVVLPEGRLSVQPRPHATNPDADSDSQ